MIQEEQETIELTVPAQSAYLRTVRLVIAGVGSTADLNVEEIDDLKTAVGEAYNMLHPSEVHAINVRAVVERRRVVVEISQGAGGAQTRFLPGGGPLDRGFGIPLMKHLVDEVEYCADADQTRIRLVKNRR